MHLAPKENYKMTQPALKAATTPALEQRKIHLARDQDLIMEAMYGTQQRREVKRMYRRRDNQ